MTDFTPEMAAGQDGVLRRNFRELWPSRHHEGTTEREVVRRELRRLICLMRLDPRRPWKERVVDFGDKDYDEDAPPKLCADCPGTDDPGCCQGDAADALGQAMEP